MKFFLDTAHVEEIQEAARWGILDGVTTNPTHVSKTGRTVSDLYPEIVKLVDGDVSLETIGLEADEIVKEGRELAKVGDNVVVKVPVMKEGLVAVKRLAAEGIRTNVTVNFQPIQALMAAKAGASYISPFVGRLDNIGHNGMELVEQIHTIYQNYGYETEIIVAWRPPSLARRSAP
jgi:transaldolase